MLKFLKLTLLTLAVGFACTSCSDDAPQPVMADTTEASALGRADAKALCDAGFTTDRELHSALLSVKSREWKMRSRGDSLQANAYINAFRRCLIETNADLADKVL